MPFITCFRYLASNKHPGGQNALLKHFGKDSSEDFDFHSGHARNKIWSKLKVGKVKRCAKMDGGGGDERCIIC